VLESSIAEYNNDLHASNLVRQSVATDRHGDHRYRPLTFLFYLFLLNRLVFRFMLWQAAMTITFHHCIRESMVDWLMNMLTIPSLSSTYYFKVPKTLNIWGEITFFSSQQ
jgi:hypothetical protein